MNRHEAAREIRKVAKLIHANTKESLGKRARLFGIANRLEEPTGTMVRLGLFAYAFWWVPLVLGGVILRGCAT